MPTFLSLALNVPPHVREPGVKIRRRCRHLLTELLARARDRVARVTQHQCYIARFSLTAQVHARFHTIHVTYRRKLASG